MKRLILSMASLLILAGYASAQSSVKKTTGTPKRPHAAVTKKTSEKRAVKTDSLDNRKNYHWKNGQTATPTGNEASSSNGTEYSSQKGDSSGRKKKN
jgi:hypothetical protein